LEVLCQAGDRIDGIRISFRHMVFEDALTILSYALPYDVQLEVENSSSSCPNTLVRTKKTSGSGIAPADRICHPFYRSQSISDLGQVSTAMVTMNYNSCNEKLSITPHSFNYTCEKKRTSIYL